MAEEIKKSQMSQTIRPSYINDKSKRLLESRSRVHSSQR